jgi:hypothetical protein
LEWFVRIPLVEQSDREHWLEVIAESDELLEELSDSEDPVTQRAVAKALFAKIKALHQLDRRSESVAVADELVRRFAVEPDQALQRSVLRALLSKAADLGGLGETAEALDTLDALLALSDSLDQTPVVRKFVAAALVLKMAALGADALVPAFGANSEIIHRFADSDEPFLHEQVTEALVRAGVFQLFENTVDDAIQTARLLAERVDTAPEETLLAELEPIQGYALKLNRIAGPDWRGIAETFAFATANTSAHLTSLLIAKLNASGHGSVFEPLQRATSVVGARMTPRRWEFNRRRIEAAIELEQRVILRVADHGDADLQRVTSAAHLHIGMARVTLGQTRQGLREIAALIDNPDSAAAVQALQAMAADLRGRGDLMGQLGELGALSWRAQALGQGDHEIEQIAYEDSIKPLMRQTTRRPVRWMAAFLRPNKKS